MLRIVKIPFTLYAAIWIVKFCVYFVLAILAVFLIVAWFHAQFN